jgi:hypothetical protein
VAEQEGVAIACELYDVDEQRLQRLAEVEPHGWVRPASAGLAARGEDVSAFGSWAAYMNAGDR